MTNPPDGDDMTRTYVQERDRLRRVAYLMVGRREEAEEIVHDAFAHAARRWDTIDTPAAYLRTSVVNLCLERRRRAALERRHNQPTPVTPTSQPEIDETWDLLARLPDNQRVAVVLRFYDDLAIDAIAQVMSCRPATVRTRIHRALARLRKEMTR